MLLKDQTHQQAHNAFMPCFPPHELHQAYNETMLCACMSLFLQSINFIHFACKELEGYRELCCSQFHMLGTGEDQVLSASVPSCSQQHGVDQEVGEGQPAETQPVQPVEPEMTIETLFYSGSCTD